MPMYEYRCKSCGTVNEFLVGVSSDEPEIACESCGSKKLSRMLSITNFAVASSARGSEAQCCRADGGEGCSGGNCACAAM